ncbi:universal stress protein [Chelativorans sp. Marseille-P2723]|uniref:universal stress protein n=1 Tax=Chelativorans sp. Marseille-P2723 TaxID=2709133 RepID=UPI00156E66F5|nr:universal stress protein [Chelativorans sp. Marseille-P2723]
MYKHILIATDGSELADKGLEHGLKLASALGAQVSVLTVSPPLSHNVVQAARIAGIEDPISRYDQQIADEMKEQFASIEKKAAAHGLKINLIHEIDDFPAEAIVRFAKLKGCDLIVMSSHGRRGARRLILGSQTAEVVTTTTIPVLVVR